MKTQSLASLSCPRCCGHLTTDRTDVPPVSDDDGRELREGLLCCEQCGELYPVICGVALLLPDVNSWLRSNY